MIPRCAKQTYIAEDILEGADVVVNQLLVDITLTPEKSGKIGDVRISSGFRMSNGAQELKMPVCVILFQAVGRATPIDMLEKLQNDPLPFRELADDAFSSFLRLR